MSQQQKALQERLVPLQHLPDSADPKTRPTTYPEGTPGDLLPAGQGAGRGGEGMQEQVPNRQDRHKQVNKKNKAVDPGKGRGESEVHS